MAARVRVMIAEDHPLFRGALREAVRSRPDLALVGEASDGREALEQLRSLRPDVAVLDLRMPDLGGEEVLNAVERDGLGVRVLFCAASTDSKLVYECLAAGAAGYLDKGATAEEICDAIASVARGETVLSERLRDEVVREIGAQRRPREESLTRRELEVLRLLADGLSGPAIAKRLYVEPSTIKTHLQNLYAKLEVSDRAAAVAEGMRRGLVE